jgi:predicted RNA-binding Zn-ribbon protein involved in translation (DUF1610 family)
MTEKPKKKLCLNCGIRMHYRVLGPRPKKLVGPRPKKLEPVRHRQVEFFCNRCGQTKAGVE